MLRIEKTKVLDLTTLLIVLHYLVFALDQQQDHHK